jgi:Holliday junction DNA helicase RuvB
MLNEHLQPSTWDDFVDHDQAKALVRTTQLAAQARGESMEHVLLYGPSGLGKTAFARLVGGPDLKVFHGSDFDATAFVLPSVPRYRNRFHPTKPKDEAPAAPIYYFVDEIHALEPDTQNMVLKVVDSLSLRATLIGATTEPSMLITPLRNRFSVSLRFDFYEHKDLATIVSNSATVLKLQLGAGVAWFVAKCSRGTPRVANNLLRRIRDVSSAPTLDQAREILVSLGIDEYGINSDERNYIAEMWFKFGGGPVGLSTMAGAMSESDKTLKGFYEPYLLRLGIIEIVSRGRKLTTLGQSYAQHIMTGGDS